MFLFTVSDFRQAGMPVRAVVATREDAVAVARALGTGELDPVTVRHVDEPSYLGLVMPMRIA